MFTDYVKIYAQAGKVEMVQYHLDMKNMLRLADLMEEMVEEAETSISKLIQMQIH